MVWNDGDDVGFENHAGKCEISNSLKIILNIDKSLLQLRIFQQVYQ